jgi:hypothetical protein
MTSPYDTESYRYHYGRSMSLPGELRAAYVANDWPKHRALLSEQTSTANAIRRILPLGWAFWPPKPTN